MVMRIQRWPILVFATNFQQFLKLAKFFKNIFGLNLEEMLLIEFCMNLKNFNPK